MCFRARNGVDVPIEQRDIGLIFQTYALWPHLTVERNVAYPLERRKLPAAERKSRVAKYLELIDCSHLASRYPHELSGGQQQRIALARALVYEPAVVLFDEPLSNLDPTLRERLRAEIRELQRRVGFTGIYVTHDQGEAFYVGDRIALLNEGGLVQVGTADQIYSEPSSPLVAAFAGATNVTEGEMANSGATFVSADLGRISLGNPRPCKGESRYVLLVRPESVQLMLQTSGQAQAVVLDRTMAGALHEYALQLPTGRRWRGLSRRATAGSMLATPSQSRLNPEAPLSSKARSRRGRPGNDGGMETRLVRCSARIAGHRLHCISARAIAAGSSGLGCGFPSTVSRGLCQPSGVVGGGERPG